MTPANPTKEPARKHTSFTEPTALKQLAERITVAEIATKMGLNSTTIHSALNGSKPWRLTSELAARHILSKLDRHDSGTHTLVIQLPAAKLPMVETFLEAVQARVFNLTKHEVK